MSLMIIVSPALLYLSVLVLLKWNYRDAYPLLHNIHLNNLSRKNSALFKKQSSLDRHRLPRMLNPGFTSVMVSDWHNGQNSVLTTNGGTKELR